MTDVKRLLAEAAVETPLGDWWTNGLAIFDNINQPVADVEDSPPNAALIVYAVNHLPDYLAAVEALERVETKMAEWERATKEAGVFRDSDPDAQMGRWVRDEARAALARLRDKVTA